MATSAGEICGITQYQTVSRFRIQISLPQLHANLTSIRVDNLIVSGPPFRLAQVMLANNPLLCPTQIFENSTFLTCQFLALSEKFSLNVASISRTRERVPLWDGPPKTAEPIS